MPCRGTRRGETQGRDLKTAGGEKIVTEQVSSVTERPQLTAAPEFVREGMCFLLAE